MRSIIVGGGIAGLAFAVALRRAGWDVEVLERAPEFTEAGAGLSLWPNALRAVFRLHQLAPGDAAGANHRYVRDLGERRAVRLLGIGRQSGLLLCHRERRRRRGRQRASRVARAVRRLA